MRDLNSIIIEGNLTRDPEFRQTPKGTAVCMFAVASNRYFKVDDETREEVSFFNVETWAKVAESCNEYLKKGRGVRVIGRLKQDRWVNQDGKNCDRIKIVAEHVEFKPQFRKQQEGAIEGAGVEKREAESAEIAAENPAGITEPAETPAATPAKEPADEVAAAKKNSKNKEKDDELLEAV